MGLLPGLCNSSQGTECRVCRPLKKSQRINLKRFSSGRFLLMNTIGSFSGLFCGEANVFCKGASKSLRLQYINTCCHTWTPSLLIADCHYHLAAQTSQNCSFTAFGRSDRCSLSYWKRSMRSPFTAGTYCAQKCWWLAQSAQKSAQKTFMTTEGNIHANMG